MAINIPGDLAWVLEMLGYDWPPLDEDEIHRAAAITRTFKADLEGTIEIADARITNGVPEGFKSKAAASYTDAWSETRSTHMRQLVDLLDPAAVAIDALGAAILGLKVKVIAELAITAAQIIAAIASAAFTFGLSAAANVAIIIARKKALDFLTNVAIDAIMGQILSMLIEPLTNTAIAFIGAIQDAPLVKGAVGEVKAFQADFAALEQTASDIDTNGADQERIGSDYIAQITSLQIIVG